MILRFLILLTLLAILAVMLAVVAGGCLVAVSLSDAMMMP